MAEDLLTTRPHSALLTVVIPTAGRRPQWLARAIESALQVGLEGNVEVIVVPNGPNESWERVAEQFGEEPRVKWHPIKLAHANAARNHGLKQAAGEYVRFLDDDDYFFPEPARAQLMDAVEASLDLSVAPVEIVNPGKQRVIYDLPREYRSNFLAFVLCPDRNTLPTAYLFKRSSISGLEWDESLSINQDTKWMLDVARSFSGTWEIRKAPVGVWWQHSQGRISKDTAIADRATIVFEMLNKTFRSIPPENMCGLVAKSFSDAVWKCAHLGFPSKPLFWAPVMRRILVENPGYVPPQKMFQVLSPINPVALEWLALPLRGLRQIWKT